MTESFVVCMSNEGYEASLIVRRIYPRLEDASARDKDLIRVIDESGEGYLYPSSLFEPVELSVLAKKRIRSTTYRN
jgi:hypothetical protein